MPKFILAMVGAQLGHAEKSIIKNYMIQRKKIPCQADKKRLRFGAQRRLKKSSEFEQVYSHRLSASDERLVVYARPNGLNRSRLGVSVGRKLGPAVRRNRYKRTLREAFRLMQHELPTGYDFVLVPREHAAASTRLYCQSLAHLCRKLHRRSESIKDTT